MSKQNPKLTSITEAKAAEFVKTAALRKSLACQNITGFHLTRLAKGASWRYRYTDLAGKVRVATIGSYSEMKAEQAAQRALDWIFDNSDPLAEKKSQQATAKKEAALAEQRSIRKYLRRDYARYMESWSEVSAETNTRRFENHFKAFLDRDMTTITREDIRAWEAQMEAKGSSYATIKRTYGAFKSLLNHAAANDVIPENPIAKVKLTPPSKEVQSQIVNDPLKSQRRMLTKEEKAGLYKALNAFSDEIRAQRSRSIKHGKKHLPDLSDRVYPHWFVPFTLLAYHTGLRTGDLFSLTWDELNVKFGRLRKMPEKTTGKAIRSGRKPAVVDVTLSADIKQTMSTWHKEQGKPDTGYVFPSPVTGRRMDKNAHDKAWKQVKALAGIDSGLTFYALRHNFISQLISEGIPPLTVAQMVGHKSADMIEQHYGHLCAARASDAMDIMAASFRIYDEPQGKEYSA